MDITLAQLLADIAFGAAAVVAFLKKEAAVALAAAGLFLLTLAQVVKS